MDRKYGRKRDVHDDRDKIFRSSLSPKVIPRRVDLRPFMGPIKDQGNEGSCTGHAGSSAVEMIYCKYKNAAPLLSPQNLYVNELLDEGSFPEDAGAAPRTICKILNSLGVSEESIEPYTVGKFVKPTDAQVANALKYKLGGYHRITSLQDFLLCLGDPTPWPVPIGFDVYASFETDQVANTGMMPVPDTSHETLMGGHETLGVGYDLDMKCSDGSLGVAIVQNSYGASWGDHGVFYMPLKVLGDANMASDKWIIHPGHWS
jgi:C1A family cysteine protease